MKGLVLPPPVASAWVRDIRNDHSNIKLKRLFDRAARPLAADLAAALVPHSEPLPGGIVRLHVPIGPGFKDDTIKPGQRTWIVDFDPRTGNWWSSGAAPWELGIAGLAAHVWRVMGRCSSGPMDARRELLASLGFAVLCALAAEEKIVQSAQVVPL
jgi:hypothetical protein